MSTKQMSDFFASKLLRELRSTPALTSAFTAQTESAKVGFDFSEIQSVFAKVREEYVEMEEAYLARAVDPTHFAEELGDCLFTLVNLARWCSLDPEELLNRNVEKYLLRCNFIEKRLELEKRQWKNLDRDEIYKLWKVAKHEGL
mgnify:CR=1 FL=1